MQNPQSPSLHARRKAQTLRAIHEAALTLTCARGLEAVTVEDIARAAGVSPRTFFNYFPHKDASLVGPPMLFPEEAAEALATGQGPLRPALEAFLLAHAAQFLPRRAQLAQVIALSPDSPRLLAIRQIALYGRRDVLAALLARRLPEAAPLRTTILAHAVLAATGAAIEGWAQGEGDDLPALVRAAIDNIASAAALLEP